MVHFTTLGNLLGPIYFGAAIDSACLQLETDECGQTGACFLYDLKRYRFVFVGMLFAFSTLNSLCVWTAYHSLKRQDAKNQRQHAPLEEQVSIMLQEKKNGFICINAPPVVGSISHLDYWVKFDIFG